MAFSEQMTMFSTKEGGIIMSKAQINKAIIGTKLGVTQFFDEDGVIVDVTAIEVGPCYVVQKKTIKRDGYESLQIAYKEAKEKNVKKPQAGHFKKAGVKPTKILKEYKFVEEVYNKLNEGDILTIEQFNTTDYVDVTSKSKGAGFAGVMKRHGFSGRPATHGTHESFRGPGSIGACATPGRVYKGRKMPGQMGNKNVTTQNLYVYKVDAKNSVLYLRGHVPGSKGTTIYIKDSTKKPSEPFYV